ncbi:Enhancer of mrna-decapping protein, partial [Thalictrum thalictroides]
GPLNREVKIWVSASEEGWLLPSDADSWKCTQTLDLKSSAETRLEEAFFNQVVALPRAGLILLANAKKNAIYAVHIEYGPCPAATRMDYIAEFTVTMPILSLTGTSDSLPEGNHIVQVYCVQTQAIQQYALDLSQCLPPPLENMGLEKADSNANHTFGKSSSDGLPVLEASQGIVPTEMPVGSAAYKQHIVSISESAPSVRYSIFSGVPDVPSLHDLSTLETKQNVVLSTVSDADSTRAASPSVPLSPKLSGNLSGFRSPSNNFEPISPLGIHPIDQQVLDYSADGRVETVPANISDSSPLDDKSRKGGIQKQNDISTAPNVIHLVTSSEFSSVPSSDISQGLSGGEVSFQDLANSNDLDSAEVEVKVGDSEKCQNDEFESQREADIHVAEKKEKSFYSQAADLNIRMARECCSLSTEALNADSSAVKESFDSPTNVGEEEFQNSSKDGLVSISESASVNTAHTPLSGTKAKKQKGKNLWFIFGVSSTDSFIEPGNTSAVLPGSEVSLPNILALLETVVNQ